MAGTKQAVSVLVFCSEPHSFQGSCLVHRGCEDCGLGRAVAEVGSRHFKLQTHVSHTVHQSHSEKNTELRRVAFSPLRFSCMQPSNGLSQARFSGWRCSLLLTVISQRSGRLFLGGASKVFSALSLHRHGHRRVHGYSGLFKHLPTMSPPA